MTPVRTSTRHRKGPTRDRLPRTTTPTFDVETLLLESAESVLTQLRVLRSLASSRSEAQRLVVEVHETAVDQSIAPAGAIGVTAVLAELLCRPDEHELAELLHRARAAFTDDELISGAAAMLAATSIHLGRHTGLEPAVVADEVARHRRGAG